MPTAASPSVERIQDTAAPDKLGLPLILSYGVGTVGSAVLLNTVTAYLPALMTTVLGRSAALAGLLLTLSKLYDIVADITIGVVSDRTRSRWGRRRPFLLAGSIISALSFFLLFSPPQTSDLGLIVYVAGALVIYSTGYSLFNVPYIAMPAEMTSGYHERTRLLSFRTFFAAVGQIAGLAGAAWLVQIGGAGAAGYRLMGAVLAMVILGATLLTVLGTAKAVQTERTLVPDLSVFRRVSLLATNRPLMLLMGAKFLQFVSLACIGSTGLLFRLNVLKIGYGVQAELTTVQNVVTALSMPAWVWLGRRLGKKWAYIMAIGLYAACSLSWLWAAAGDPRATFDLRAAILGFGAGGILLMSISMLPDIMQYDFLRTGLRREGVFSSFYAIVEKVGFAIGPGMIGLYLASSGYSPTTRGHLVQQPPHAVQALYMSNTVIPAALLLGSLLLIMGYRIDEKTLADQRAG